MNSLAPTPRSSAAAALALLLAGDLPGLARKLPAVFSLRPSLLPARLKPCTRASGIATPAPHRDRPLVWMIGTSFERDGAPLSQFELASGLVKTGFRISVKAAVDGPLRHQYASAGIDASVLAELACSAAVPAWYERDVQQLARVVAKARPDLIFASTVDAFPAIDAARLVGIPSLWNIRESEPWRARLADRHTAIAARGLACFSYPQSVIFVARATRNVWAHFLRQGASAVVHNAPHPDILAAAQVDPSGLRKQLGIAANERVLVSVGTLCERKGQVDLALALNALPPALLEELRVAFVGRCEGDYEAQVRRALGPEATQRCLFAGAVSSPMVWIAAADVLVNTSRSEAFPRTFIEAAVARTPIVAAAIDGTTERLSDGRSALLYPPGDTNTLAVKLSLLLGDEEMAERLTEEAHADLVDCWSYDDMIRAYGELIRSGIG